jgi:hypothetical protein
LRQPLLRDRERLCHARVAPQCVSIRSTSTKAAAADGEEILSDDIPDPL